MIPKELTELKQWVCVADKLPYDPKEELKLAKVNDPTTWGSYEDCLNREKDFSQMGFVFNNNGIIGIDIDTGLDQDGTLNEETCDIISRCHSYTEFSKNKRGVHIFIKGHIDGDKLVVDKNGYHIELYQARAYFVCTQDTLLEKEICENQEVIEYILEHYFITPYKETFYKPQYETPTKHSIPLEPTHYPDIIQGSRNQSLLSYGGHLIRQGLEANEIFQELLKMNSSKCRPPLERKEVEAIAKQVLKYYVRNKNE